MLCNGYRKVAFTRYTDISTVMLLTHSTIMDVPTISTSGMKVKQAEMEKEKEE